MVGGRVFEMWLGSLSAEARGLVIVARWGGGTQGVEERLGLRFLRLRRPILRHPVADTRLDEYVP